LILTESDLIDFLVAVVKGVPPIRDQVRSVIADEEIGFLFIGFGFHNWYLRVLLKVIGVYKRNSKQMAFEDSRFFSHPCCKETVGFFSGERCIEFHALQWEQFAGQMRDIYLAKKPADSLAVPAKTDKGGERPVAFLSYASEDAQSIERLAEQLESRGVAIWQDRQNLRVGDNWERVLVSVIEKQVNYFVLVQTPAMMNRIEGVFKAEIDVALKRQGSMNEADDGLPFRFMLPVKIGECNSFYKLKEWHCIDVNTEAGVDKLAGDILDDWKKRRARIERAGVPA
jgi:hypothetical protein